MRSIRLIALLLLLTAGLTSRAQLYRNDFDNGYAWYPPWENLVLAADSTHPERGLVCICDSTREFGLEFKSTFDDSLGKNNLRLRFDADFRFPDTVGTGEIALTITKGNETRYWVSYPLSDYAADSARWFHVNIEANLPNDYLEGSLTKLFLWNRYHSRVFVDNAEIELTPWTLPSFLPAIQRDSITEDSFVLRPDDPPQTPVTYPIGMLTEYILNGDTVTEYQLFKKPKDTKTDLFEFIAVSAIDTTYVPSTTDYPGTNFDIRTIFTKEAKLLRKSIVVPFVDSTLTVYRKNLKTENGGRNPERRSPHRPEGGNFGLTDRTGGKTENEYYLDREGFKIGEGQRAVISYHQTGISSTQFDAANRVAYFNIDYWRDHPMIHYPLSETLENHFEDCSSRHVYQGMEWSHYIVLYNGNDVQNLPRIMPIPYGYESGIIFTEHADWTDIRTHRAVLFGSEKITKAKDAIGGFVYYGIPVTKSVFYNNPDQITNDAISRGTFKGLHTTIKTDREFDKLLKQLYKLDFDICLHTPEQYTTTPSNLKEALDYMQRHFKSTTWIDHGYNNGPIHNREDMVCDGLDHESENYAGYQWQSHGIKYLWNAYYEENRMEQWHFDNNLMQPYPGFGDALPNRQITTITEKFLTWCTPSTLEAVTDDDWDFYYSEQRLQRIVDNHDVHITHVYPAWVRPGRTFWTYDADSTIVALPGMNRALERIANLRNEHKMLPMTVKTYLDYYSGLLNVSYEIIDAEHILLHNTGKKVKGFTLLCPSPIRFEDNRYYDFRKSGDYYYIWFDLEPNDNVKIRIINN